MPVESPLNDALLFASVALCMVLVALSVRAPQRRAMLVLLVVVALGVLALWLYEGHRGAIQSAAGATLAREGALAVIAFGVIQISVLFIFQTLLMRRRMPRILTEFVVALTLIGYAIYRLNAVGVNLGSLITTSAILGALAFSAQETLTNLWGGITIQLEKSCRIGDWVRLDNQTGQVVSIRWRYMAIATITNETIVIPNSQVMKNRITVLARRGEERCAWRRYVAFEVEYEFAPAQVIAHVEKELAHAQIAFVARHPTPSVACAAFLDSGIQYEVAYDLTDPAEYWTTDSRIRVHVYAALLRQGLVIPYPRRIVEIREDARPGLAQREIERRIAALMTMDLFASLTDGERASLAHELTTSAYVPGEKIFAVGEPADSLYLLAQGSVDVVKEDGNQARVKLAVLDAPAYFGEMGLLLGQPRAATIVAGGDTVCYRLEKRAFDAIIKARPQLAEMLARILAERQAANDATLQALDAEARVRQRAGSTKDLVRRIRQFFGIAGSP